MEKTISLEASKKLQGVMHEETVFSWYEYIDEEWQKITSCWFTCKEKEKHLLVKNVYKTLTLEEAIDMLPKKIINGDVYGLYITYWYYYGGEWWAVMYNNNLNNNMYTVSEISIIDSIENMLLYLYDNNLLDNKEVWTDKSD